MAMVGKDAIVLFGSGEGVVGEHLDNIPLGWRWMKSDLRGLILPFSHPSVCVWSDGGFNLEDALSRGNAQDTPAHSGRSKNAGSVGEYLIHLERGTL